MRLLTFRNLAVVSMMMMCFGCAPATSEQTDPRRARTEQNETMSPATIAALIGLVLLLVLANDVEAELGTAS